MSHSKKLIVLDINGVIAVKIRPPCLVLTNQGKHIIDSLSKRHAVALYSSCIPANVWRFIHMYKLKDKLTFVFARDMTYTDDASGPFESTKHLDIIFERYPQFNYNNTIIVDDTPSKLRFNPEKNCLIVKPGMDILKHINRKLKQL